MKKHNKKTLRLGSYTMALSAAFLAVLIIINLLAGALPTTVTQIDTTNTKINSIGSETTEILNSLNRDVSIWLLVEKDNETSVAQIDNLIKRYAEKSSHVKYSVIDPALYPNFAAQYTTEKLTDGAVIVATDLRSYVINGSEWFMYETDYGKFDSYTYSYYAQMGYVDGSDPYMFYGEANLTAAIDNVTSEKLPRLYTLTGHGEAELSDTFKGYLSKDSVDSESLNLMTGDGKVPADCDVLFINQPQLDVSAEEKNAVSDYYKNGGNIILITSLLNYSAEKEPNLAALAAEMGMKSDDGVIVEQNQSYYMQYPIYLVPKAGEGGPMSLVKTAGLTYFFPNSHAVKSVGTDEFTYNSLLSVTDQAMLKKNIETFESFEKEEGDTDGPFDVAASTVKSGENGESKFAWFASPSIVDETCDYGGNSALFTSTVDWMCEKTTNVSVIGTEMDNSYLTATSADVTLWNTVLMGILPLSFLGAGAYIWYRRRKR